MKKTLLLLIAPLAMYSQEFNFGAKISSVTIDNTTDMPESSSSRESKRDAFNFGSATGFSGFIEIKGKRFAGELEFMHYKSQGDATTNIMGNLIKQRFEVNALIPSLSFKYYPASRFVLKTGVYTNPSKIKMTTSVNGYIKTEEITNKDTGMLFGFEVYPYKGIILDIRFLTDFNTSDDINGRHIVFGIGYKI